MTSQPNVEMDWTACKYDGRDERLHAPTSEGDYNESAYFNFVCDSIDDGPLGGVLRVGLRPVDGYSEYTLLLPLADGTTVFRYAREDLSSAEFQVGAPELASGGMRLAVTNASRAWSLMFDDEARILPDLQRFGDQPGVEWRAAKLVRVEVDLRFTATHAMHMLSQGGGFAPGAETDTGGARDHFEQFGLLSGSIGVGGRVFELEAWSLRDRSWGPRAWDKLPAIDQVMAFFENGTRLVSANAECSPGMVDAHGIAWLPERDEPVPTPVFDQISEYAGTSSIVRSFPLHLVIDDRPVHLDAAVVSMFPTRVGKTHRDALTLVRLDGDLGAGAAWIDLMRERADT